MKYISLIFVLFCLTELSPGRVLVEEDFEDGLLSARGWTDIAKWGVDRSLSIAGTPEVKPISGRKCLKIRYAEGDTGGWMHIRFPKEVREVYCRYYRLFPADWEWPKGYGPHDSIVFAGSYGAPTDTDLSIYLDFWKTGETFVRGATARQKWGYGGYSQVLRKYGGMANRLPYNVSRADIVKPDQWHCVARNRDALPLATLWDMVANLPFLWLYIVCWCSMRRVLFRLGRIVQLVRTSLA